jgi:UDP-glucose 4-epimerase
MRILVTGGAGFIGSHLCEKLVQEGHSVTALDDLSTGRISNVEDLKEPSFKLVAGSILDKNLLADLILQADYVFHLAAAVGVFNIVNNPLESLLINIRGTENVLEATSLRKIPVFLASSSEVYGKNVSDALKENDDRILGSPVTLRWSYSEAKAIDESLAFAYFVEKGLETRIVRFFNTVGPRQLGVYGNGNQTRCFAHVYDVIEAINAIAFADNTIGKVINIGNNFEISINDLAQKIITETNSSSSIEYVEYEKAYGNGFEDMERRVPNIDLINELVGWKPSRNLSRIISDIALEMKKSF